MSERLKVVFANALVIVVLCLLTFVAGTWWRLQTQFALGEAANQRGDFSAAVAGYESAIHMYIPGHPAIERSAMQLWNLGELNERQGDIGRALVVYRSLRSSFYAVRWLVSPGQEWIAKCDKKIARLGPLQTER